MLLFGTWNCVFLAFCFVLMMLLACYFVSWCFLRYCISPCWYRGVQVEQWCRKYAHPSCAWAGDERSVEGSGPTYHHDWYPDGSAVVHLRFSESVLPSPPSPTPWGTRELEEETTPEAASCLNGNRKSFYCAWPETCEYNSGLKPKCMCLMRRIDWMCTMIMEWTT